VECVDECYAAVLGASPRADVGFLFGVVSTVFGGEAAEGSETGGVVVHDAGVGAEDDAETVVEHFGSCDEAGYPRDDWYQPLGIAWMGWLLVFLVCVQEESIELGIGLWIFHDGNDLDDFAFPVVQSAHDGCLNLFAHIFVELLVPANQNIRPDGLPDPAQAEFNVLEEQVW
jgi:hypothetical protein